ncbi:MAG: tRNA (adenosine(37)-N6)-threonylcarbamoyltransferase complex ATPase subunit type 1 TsaE [Planctomycetota bacterium]
MPRITIETESVERTDEFGRRFAQLLRPGDVVLLDGELGSGKTALVRAIAVSLGADPDQISSPTFVLLNLYDTPGTSIAHLDAYRLDDDELDALGWDRAVTPETIALIEWGSRIAAAVRNRSDDAGIATIEITQTGATSRRFELELPEAWSDRPAWRAIAEDSPDGPAAGTEREDTTCRVTGRHVPADSPTWPFADERARMADLYRWFAEDYSVSRPVEQSDLEQDD